MQQHIYDKLLSLPLFQGLTTADLQRIVANVRLDFMSLKAGKTIVKEMEECCKIIFLMDGDIYSHSTADDHSYSLTERLTAPMMLQPEHLFGLSQYYSKTFTTATDCHLVAMAKADVVELMSKLEIFRINLLNIYSTDIQKRERMRWHVLPQTVRDRVVRFFISHSAVPRGEKTFKITMRTLALATADSRLDVSRVLNALAADGLINLSRSTIHIPALEKL
jgi:CRP/FNR family cyclic AMP-dependent transcriptional regulator